MQSKGFPESYDGSAILRFLSDVKAGKPQVKAPVYSHLVYDVVPGESVTVERPDILILDEPTQGLDQPGEAAFYRLIEEVRREMGVSVLMVSHDLHVVMAASDRVICLNGHICCEGTPRVVSTAPEYRALFGLGTQGALALYQHVHDHSHDGGHDHAHHDHNHQEHDHHHA
jgi:zinc transport system ATP-binding protein